MRIRTDKDGDWTEHGIVMNTSSEPRSYCVKNAKGNIVRRNRKHLLPTKEMFKEKIDYDDLRCVDLEKPKVYGDRNDKEVVQENSQSNPILSEENIPVTKSKRSGRLSRKPGYLSDYVTT